jgi:hypothetical protein
VISKGTTNNNGIALARYLLADKAKERAELWELRGFEATNLEDAFRDVHIMADATRCEKPFFHVQVRNREGETLTRQQWEMVANRIERMMGLVDQPRAIAFHIDEKTGHEHLHVVWSRIDQDTLKAVPLPFFKRRLNKISRELEMELSLEPVTSIRPDRIDFAPTRAEEEQSRRLGTDLHAIRNTIRNCFERSDCGSSLRAALEQEGLVLAKGDRRDFIVIDQEGGMHALGKRITGASAADIRKRLHDLDRDQLPSIEQARTRQYEREAERSSQEREHLRLLLWEDRLAKTAISKEQVTRQFVEPTPAEFRKREEMLKSWPFQPQEAPPIRTSPQYHFEDAARATNRNEQYVAPKPLTGMTAQIEQILIQLQNDPSHLDGQGRTLSEVLDYRGIMFAKVTKEEAQRSHREAAFAKAVGNNAARYREGEIVAVREPHLEYRRNGEIREPLSRVYKLDQPSARRFVAELGDPNLKNLESTLVLSGNYAHERAEHWASTRHENATNILDFSRSTRRRVPRNHIQSQDRIIMGGVGAIAKAFDIVGDVVDSVFSAKITPGKPARTNAERRSVTSGIETRPPRRTITIRRCGSRGKWRMRLRRKELANGTDETDESQGHREPPGNDQGPTNGPLRQGFIQRLSNQFRAAMKELTAPPSGPKPRVKRRGGRDSAKGFSIATRKILERNRDRSPFAHAIGYLTQTLDWLEMWEDNRQVETPPSEEQPSQFDDDSISLHL